MSSSGPLYTGTGANNNDGGTTAWTNPTNVQGDTTATAATCNIGTNGGTSQQLRCSNFGFSIPAGATIDGVTAEVEWSAANANRHFQNNIRLLKTGAETGNNKSTGAAIPTTKGFTTFGAANDLWGATLTPTDVNATGFGVSIKIGRTASQATTTSVFRVRLTVTYHENTNYSVTAGSVAAAATAPVFAQSLAAIAGAIDLAGVGPVFKTELPASSGSFALAGVGPGFNQELRLGVTAGALEVAAVGPTFESQFFVTRGTFFFDPVLDTVLRIDQAVTAGVLEIGATGPTFGTSSLWDVTAGAVEIGATAPGWLLSSSWSVVAGGLSIELLTPSLSITVAPGEGTSVWLAKQLANVYAPNSRRRPSFKSHF